MFLVSKSKEKNPEVYRDGNIGMILCIICMPHPKLHSPRGPDDVLYPKALKNTLETVASEKFCGHWI